MADKTRTDACPAEPSGLSPVTPSRRVGDLNWNSVVFALGVFAVFDFLAFPLDNLTAKSATTLIAGVAIIGSGMGQFLVLSVWSTCGRLPYLVRLVVWPAVAVFLFGVFVTGANLSVPFPYTYQVTILVFLCIPFLLFFAQIPIVLSWFFVGWRRTAVASSEKANPGMGGQYTILHLMGLMFYVALVLGLANAGIQQIGHDRAAQSWRILLATGGALALTNLFLGMPVLWAVFAVEDKKWACRIVVTFSFILGLAFVSVVSAMAGSAPSANETLCLVGGVMLAAAISLGVLHATLHKGVLQDESSAVETHETVGTPPAVTE